MKGINIILPNNQRGAATLVTALILLLAITLVTFSAARVGVTEQRTSANDMRAKTAQDVANAGVEYGIAYLNKNNSLINQLGGDGWGAGGSSGTTWQRCAAATDLPCGDGTANIYNNAGPGFTNWLFYTVLAGKLEQPSDKYSYTVSYLSPCAGACVNLIPEQDTTVVVIAQAQATGGGDVLAARAVSRQVVRSALGLGRLPQAPVMAAGTVDLSGNMDIWGNPTGILVPPTLGTANPRTAPGTGATDITYGILTTPPPPAPPYQRTSTLTVATGLTATATLATGRPLSVWAPADISAVSSATKTCLPFYSNNTVISSRDGSAGGSSCGGGGTIGDAANRSDMIGLPAVAGSPPNSNRVSAYLADGSTCWEPFPGSPYNPPLAAPNPVGCPIPAGSLFEYTFGVPSARSDEIKNQSTILSDCDTIHLLPAARYWVVGTCSIRGGTTIVGSLTEPFVVIVEGDLDIGGSNTKIYGLIYVRGTGRNVTMNGGLFRGALVSESPINRINGNNEMVYDADVLLRASTNAGTFRSITGGWADEM